jgi:hypothetical protein
VVRILMAALAMGAVVAVASGAIQATLGASRPARLLNLSLTVPAGAVIFYLASRWLKVAELEMAARALLAPLGRWAGKRRDRI